jgi:hypothetical protein
MGMSGNVRIWLMHMKVSYILLMGMLFAPVIANAVLFYSTGDISFNTNAPSGGLEGSGWQFQGKFRNSSNNKYLGTPIAPHHFITAKHISGVAVGEKFNLNGVEYTTIAKINDSGSDLTLWEVDGTFPSYAPIYSATDEVGKDLVVFGRGTQRGDAVVANGNTKGWKWGSKDYVVRWGENNVAGVADYAVGGDAKLLRAEFNSGEGVNECMLSDKDSGGGLFIEDDGMWKLAGINYSVFPASFSYSSSGTPSFNAAMFDYSFKVSDSEKVYYYTGSTWTYFNGNADKSCSFYSTRISSRYTWITNNIPDFDQDVDGLPDWWETLYVGDATSMERNGHLDGDGFTNYEEWLADTDPTVTTSRFQIIEWKAPTNVTFSSSSDRQYQIEYRIDLADTNVAWATEVAWTNGTNGQTVKSVSASTSNRFYRVRAKL